MSVAQERCHTQAQRVLQGSCCMGGRLIAVHATSAAKPQALRVVRSKFVSLCVNLLQSRSGGDAYTRMAQRPLLLGAAAYLCSARRLRCTSPAGRGSCPPCVDPQQPCAAPQSVSCCGMRRPLLRAQRRGSSQLELPLLQRRASRRTAAPATITTVLIEPIRARLVVYRSVSTNRVMECRQGVLE